MFFPLNSIIIGRYFILNEWWNMYVWKMYKWNNGKETSCVFEEMDNLNVCFLLFDVALHALQLFAERRLK